MMFEWVYMEFELAADTRGPGTVKDENHGPVV